MKRGVIGIALALTLGLAAIAAPAKKIELDVKTCHELPGELVGQLDALFKRFRPFLQLCPVSAPQGGIALLVLIFRMDWADAAGILDQAPAWPPVATPDPLVLDPSYNVLGKLSEAFPTNVPGETRVTFSDWQAGFPHRIDVRAINDAALGTHDALPLIWSAHRHRYVEAQDHPIARWTR